MKTRKNPYRSIPVQHRLEVLKERYDYDETNRTFTIVLHYEHASDLFEERLDHAKSPIMNEEVIDLISDQLSYIPSGYKAEFSLLIDDFEDYEPDIVLSSFNKQIRFLYSLYEVENKKKLTKIGVLLTVGLFFIVMTIVGEVGGWWVDTDVTLRLINYFLDTLGCVLIWEGIYAALLDSSDLMSLGLRLNRRFAGLSIIGKEKDGLPCSKEGSNTVFSWTKTKFHKRFAAFCLLLAGFGFFLTGITDVILGISPLVEAITSGGDIAMAIAIPLVELVVTGILGFLTLRLFFGNYRLLPLHWVMYFFFLILIGLGIYSMASGWLGGGEIVANVLELLVLVFYTLGFLITFITYQKEKKQG